PPAHAFQVSAPVPPVWRGIPSRKAWSGAEMSGAFGMATPEASRQMRVCKFFAAVQDEDGGAASQSRGSFSPGWCQFVVPLLAEGAGKPGAVCTRSLACNTERAHELIHYRFSQSRRLSPRNGLTVSFVLSPGKRPFLPPSLAGTYQPA